MGRPRLVTRRLHRSLLERRVAGPSRLTHNSRAAMRSDWEPRPGLWTPLGQGECQLRFVSFPFVFPK